MINFIGYIATVALKCICSRKAKCIFLLSCQHTACSSCIKQHGETGTQRKSVTYKCPVCGKIVRGRELGNNMPSHVKELFHPKPWLDEVFNAQILDFQMKQRQHFVHGFIYPLHKHFKRRNRCKQTYEQRETQRQERKHLETRVRMVIATRAKREQLHKGSRTSSFNLSTPCANSTKIHSNSSVMSHNSAQFTNRIKTFGRECLPPQTKEVYGYSSIMRGSTNIKSFLGLPSKAFNL